MVGVLYARGQKEMMGEYRIGLGVSGGIAAYKAVEVIRRILHTCMIYRHWYCGLASRQLFSA